MAENSKIEWTDHTLNFWWGCLKVSPGCEHCYAETFSKRVGRNIWGPPQTTERWRTKGPWRDCLKWDQKAQADNVRRRVFCQSMSDFFEDHPQVEPWRREAFGILEGFRSLDVQLLTKRPENVLDMVPRHWLTRWPDNVWIGTSIEDQKRADERIPELLKIPAAVRFLSVEPLLGPVRIREYLLHGYHKHFKPGIHWCIVGGESGHGARPMHPDWARSLRDQCQAAGVAYFFKQWGNHISGSQLKDLPEAVKDKFPSGANCFWMHRGGKIDPGYHSPDGTIPTAWRDGWDLVTRIDKHAAGRTLDGRIWSEFPMPTQQPAAAPTQAALF